MASTLIETLEARLVASDAELSKSTVEITKLQNELATSKEKCDTTTRSLHNVTRRLFKCQDELAASKQQNQTLINGLLDKDNKLHMARKEHTSTCEEELANCTRKLGDCQHELHACQAELKLHTEDLMRCWDKYCGSQDMLGWRTRSLEREKGKTEMLQEEIDGHEGVRLANEHLVMVMEGEMEKAWAEARRLRDLQCKRCESVEGGRGVR